MAATMIQVTSCGKACVFSCFVCLLCVFTAGALDLEIPNTAEDGYYVTKLGCSRKEIQINVITPSRRTFNAFFHITKSGDLVVHKNRSEHQSKYFVLSVRRTNPECSINLPLNLRPISIRIREVRDQMPMFSKGLYIVTLPGSRENPFQATVITSEVLKKSNVLGKDFTFDILGESSDMFNLEITQNGLEISKKSELPGLASEYHFTIVAKNQESGSVCFTHLKVGDLMYDGKLTSDMADARKRLVAMTIRTEENPLRTVSETNDHQLAVSFNQENLNVINPEDMDGQPTLYNGHQTQHIRQKRQATSLSVDVNEDVTGTLYTITRASTTSPTTFQLVSADPDGLVTVGTDSGEVKLIDGKKLDFDYGPKTITIKVNQVTGGGTVVHQHTVTINIKDVNDEVPVFTNQPSEFLAKVDATSPIGTSVFQLNATDPDENSRVEYRLEGSSTRFEVVKDTGLVKTKATLTQNLQETLQVSAVDVSATSNQKSEVKSLAITTNDRAPQFYLSKYYSSVVEDNAVDQTFPFLDAEDKEVELKAVNFQKGSKTSFTIINPNTQSASDLFLIASVGGKLKVQAKQKFDHEVKAEYTLTLRATDYNSDLFSDVELTVKIADVNEFTPTFTLTTYVASDFLETSPVGTSIIAVTALDEDTSTVMTYTLQDIDSSNSVIDNFSVEKNGEIQVKKVLDYDNTPGKMYTFKVLATDTRGARNVQKSATATVIVKMKNANDLTPQFVRNSWVQAVRDDADKNDGQKEVLNVKAIDHDGDGVTYQFPGSSTAGNGLFSIDSTTGLISLTAGQTIPNNINTYSLTVLAVDNGATCCPGVSSTLHTATTSVTINIVDALNTKPRFPSDCNGKKVKVKELQGPDSNVSDPTTAVDNSRGEYGFVDYIIREDQGFNALNYFKINSKTGQITTKVNLDRDDLNLRDKDIYITVKAQDRGSPPLSDLCTFQVVLEDINNHKPKFGSTTYKHTFLKNTPMNTVVFIARATDEDAGVNAQISYSFDPPTHNYFAIDSNSGAITLKTSVNTGSAPQKFNLTIRAEDGGTPSLNTTATLEMTVRDSSTETAPSWAQAQYTYSVSEVEPLGFLVATLTTSSGGGVKVRIENMATEENENFKFESSDNTVKIFLKKLLKYEKKSKHNLLLRASTEQTNPLNAYTTVIINVIDKNVESPKFVGIPKTSVSNFIELSVLENQPLDTTVGYVVALDKDAETLFHTVNYTVKTDQGTTNTGNFKVIADTGEVKTTQGFDAEADTGTYFVTILAQDGAISDFPSSEGPNTRPNSDTKTVKIQISDINDNTPQFTQPTFTFSVNEDAGLLHTVGRVDATDKDKGHTFYYSLASSPAGSAIPFSVGWTDGNIIVTNFLDYEKTSSYDLRVTVYDGKFSSTATVAITVKDINDQTPQFGSNIYRYDKVVSENVDYASNPFALVTLTASDGDTGRTAQTQFRYSIVSTDPDITNNFQLDASSGVLRVVGTLDRDRPGKESYRFTVAVVDEPSAPQLKGYATIIVTPVDKNDNAPVFDADTLKGSVKENSDVDTTVLRVKATDKDKGSNALLTYSIVSDSQPRHFKVKDLQQQGEQLGIVETSVNSIDREQVSQYTMKIRVQDQAVVVADRKSAEATALIVVLDENDNSPQFNATQFHVSVKESLVGDIMALPAYDLDVSSILSYSVRAVDFKHFNVEKRGMAYLQVHNSPDFDKGEDHFDVVVTVTDGKFSATCSINITILDVNDNAPNFTSVNVAQNGTFLETEPVGTKVADFAAQDIDSGMNKVFKFFILLESDPKKYFEVVSTGTGTTGEVKIRKSLDREDIETFDLVLLAIDEGRPPMTGSTTINIKVEDVNDNYPVLDANSRIVKVQEGPSVTFSKILTAEDPDTEKYGPPFRFETPDCNLATPSVCNIFSFEKISHGSENSDTLRVSCSNVKLDRETTSQYLVPVVIRDMKGGAGSKSGTSTLTIQIEDVNDNDNEDAVQSIDMYNYKGLFAHVDIGLVMVNDRDDTSDRASKRFTKVGNTYTDRYFQVNTVSGAIKLLDKVPLGAHTFKVIVVDDKIFNNEQLTTYRTKTSTTTVNVFIEELPEEAPYMSGSTRVCGTTAEKFVAKASGGSSYDKWRERMSKALNYATSDNVQIINVINKKIGDKDCIDIRYAAHGSPYFPPAVLDGIVSKYKDGFQADSGGDIVMVNIDECLSESTCEAGCYNDLVVKDEPSVVNSNEVTVVGVLTELKAVCGCRQPVNQTECTPDYCLNEGVCQKDLWGVLNCTCKSGFDGPRCQRTTQGFDGTGMGLFKPLEQCKNWVTSLEFITSNQNALLMYQGPVKVPADEDPTDFLALQLKNGYPELKVNLGTGVLTLTIDGKDSSGNSKLAKLSDNLWHHISIIKEGKFITLVVDYCKVAVSPDGGGQSDHRACEASGYTPSTHMYLNVNTPLHLGGRETSSTYPSNIIASKFNGCMRNLRHKGEIYDLHTAGTQTGVKDTCEAEDTACKNVNCGNGKCQLIKGGSSPEGVCVCDTEYRGDSCQFPTSIRDFSSNSFMDWSLASVFYTSKQTEFQLQYRSRDSDGIIFHLSSTTATEFITLQMTNGELELVFNVGDGQKALLMKDVPANDGQWHTVYVKHAGRTWIMSLDNGEGPRYVMTHTAEDGHEEITLKQNQIYSGAEVSYSSGTGTYVGKDFGNSCINDIRLETKWFPMTSSESNSNQFVKFVKQQNTQVNQCERDDCVGINCPYGQECVKLWNAHICRCPEGTELITQSGVRSCVKIDYCKDSPCFTGATCVSLTSNFTCTCPIGWTGLLCNKQSQVEPPGPPGDDDDQAGMIAGIVIGILLAIILAIILFVVIWTQCRRSDDLDNLVYDDKDDYEIRENVVAYDEEGAGEEDHEGYDLNRLRKPMDTMTRMDKPVYNTENERLGKSGIPHGPGVGDFINDRLQDADDDPNAPPHDTVQDFNHEGGGSDAGSLSSLNTSSSGGDQDYDYLNQWGPKFARLADMYNQYDDSD